MPNLTQRVVNTFVKGLITEAGELTFPENASVDELNCDLFRDGSRRRRKAIVKEDSYQTSSFSITGSTTLSFGVWKNVGNVAGTEYLVIQVGPSLFFYNKGSLPFSGQEVSGSVSLLPYEVSGTDGVAQTKCQFTSIDGSLVVTSSAMNPIYVKETSGVITATEINIRIRDFEWQGDKENYDTSLATASVSDERKYDTQNTGWVGTKGAAALSTYTSAKSAYPPLTHPWYSGKDASGSFSVSEWEEIYAGSSLIGNGHFILDLFSKDRATASGLSGLATETEPSRFVTVENFSGRVFYAGLTSQKNSGRIYFSRLLEDISEAGDCYQRNDPTSEEISDLLDDDGGVIRIPTAVSIKKLYAFKNSLFVFAENGVWQIKGVDNVFKPTSYSVSLITDIGILNESSFVAAEGVPFWWSRFGIHTLSFNDFGDGQEQNLSVATIQSFWNSIDSNAKQGVTSAYDPINKKIFWLYPENGEGVSNKKNRVLVLDITLQAFYPWKFEDQGVSTDYVLGFQFYSGFGSDDAVLDVVTSAGDDVVTSAGDDVISTQTVPFVSASASVVFFVFDVATSKMTMAFVSGSSFLDWGTANFVSYAVTGYDFIGDLVLQKNAPYIVVYTRETETGWSGDEESGYSPTNDSSLMVTGYWDFKKLPASSAQQAYRRGLPILVDSSDLSTFTSPASVLMSRLKIRGRGRSLRVRFESEQGKDFIFLGHGMIASVNDRF